MTRTRDLRVEVGLLVVGLGAYLAVRWHTLDQAAVAVAHAHDLLALERTLGLDWERGIQQATLGVPWFSSFCAQFYVWGYFPVLLPTLVWLYARRPQAYLALRDGALASGVVGFLVQAAYPVAPPRLSGSGLTDTVTGSLDALARPDGLSNAVAAVPSFHVGWLLLAGVIVCRASGSRTVRILCVLLPLTMAYVVVATGNHWVLDVPAGAGLAGVGLLAAGRGQGPTSRRRWSLPNRGAR